MKRYLVTYDDLWKFGQTFREFQSDQDGALEWCKISALSPNARVLTREQVENALFNAFVNAQSSADVMQILDELFGSESE